MKRKRHNGKLPKLTKGYKEMRKLKQEYDKTRAARLWARKHVKES